MHKGIIRVKGICGGDPIIAGTRITAQHIYDLYEKKRWWKTRIQEEYPQLSMYKINEAIKYVALEVKRRRKNDR